MAKKHLNEVRIVGNVVRQPELYRSTNEKGTEFCYITLAVDKPKIKKETPDETFYISVKLWSYNARDVVEKCLKGDKLFVSGYLETYRKGEQTVTQVVATDVIFFEKRIVGHDLMTESNPNNDLAKSLEEDNTALPFDL